MTARLPELVNARIERKARTGKKKAAKVGGLSHWGGKQPRLAKRAIHNPTTGSQSRIDPVQKMAANCFRHLQTAQRKEAREEFLRALKLRNRHAETWISSLEAQPAVNQRRLEVPKYPRARCAKATNSKAASVCRLLAALPSSPVRTAFLDGVRRVAGERRAAGAHLCPTFKEGTLPGRQGQHSFRAQRR